MIGKATLKITASSNNVQSSNYGNNSFQIANTGEKDIAKVVIDVSKALYPDSVFDPFGLAGDNASKPLQIDSNGNTGVLDPSAVSYLGTGGRSGYKGLQLNFASDANSGFNPGETVSFSIDMDPNSVAGTNKSQLDGGSSPSWDVGGVSGAELIGSTFTVTFTDGTTATGQLQGAGNQAGSQGWASQDSPNLPVSLTVNGLGAGGVGTYSPSGVSVIISGSAGKTARVVLTKGFIQPVTSYAQFLADQLAGLAATDFPANNAVEFQTVDIVLTGGNQDISNRFNLAGVPIYNFAGEDKLPLGFVASVIEPANGNLPVGAVTKPIYLEFVEPVEAKVVTIAATTQASEPNRNGLFTVSLSQVATTNTTVTYSIAGTATAGNDYTALSRTVTILANQRSATIEVPVLNDRVIEQAESVIVTLTGVTGGGVLGAAKTATVTLADNDKPAFTGTATTLPPGTEDIVYTINQADLLVGFTDVDGGALSVSGLTATNGVLTNNGNGTFSFAPNVNYNGLVNLSYNVVGDNSGSTNATQSFTIAQASSIRHAGDFDGDGKSEILWRDHSGSVAVWKLDGTSAFTLASAPIIASAATALIDWKISDTGDFDGDGKSEILWRNNDGRVSVWKLNGTSAFTPIATPIIASAIIAPIDWKISGTGDFDGDGKSEILWHKNDGSVAIWKLDGTSSFTPVSAPVIGSASVDWKIFGTGDFDGDGKSEILWRNTISGTVSVWKLDGTSSFTLSSASTVGIAPTDLKIKGVDDLDGDGRSEILWRKNDGSVVVWKLDGTSAFALSSAPVIASAANAPKDWRTSATGDFNGDGKSEILWRNTSGAVSIWRLDGTSTFLPVATPVIASAASAPNDWGIIAAPI